MNIDEFHDIDVFENYEQPHGSTLNKVKEILLDQLHDVAIFTGLLDLIYYYYDDEDGGEYLVDIEDMDEAYETGYLYHPDTGEVMGPDDGWQDRVGILYRATEKLLEEKTKKATTIRIKIVPRKNLNMSPQKMAAQVTHAVLKLSREQQLDLHSDPENVTIIVLQGVSDTKFQNYQSIYSEGVTFRDSGKTEVQPQTETVFAFQEDI